MLRPRAIEILRNLAAMDRDIDDAEIVREGDKVYLGFIPLKRDTLDQLVACNAVTNNGGDGTRGNLERWRINETGEAIARRPQLASEVVEHITRRGGSFTIKDDHIVLLDAPSEPRCEQCGFGRLVEEMREQRFHYGQDSPVELCVVVPVIRCIDCLDEWCDFRAEDIRQAAVDNFLAKSKRE